jgi:hypothetical protein
MKRNPTKRYCILYILVFQNKEQKNTKNFVCSINLWGKRECCQTIGRVCIYFEEYKSNVIDGSLYWISYKKPKTTLESVSGTRPELSLQFYENARCPTKRHSGRPHR